jgi:hypothetical protein
MKIAIPVDEKRLGSSACPAWEKMLFWRVVKSIYDKTMKLLFEEGGELMP